MQYMIYIFYISLLLKYNTVDKKVKKRKEMVRMGTIFPREEKAEQIFQKILENPYACERLQDLFFEALSNTGDGNLTEKGFASALFQAYQNRDMSAFLMAICENSMFDLLRNSFLIPIRFHDKGVTNPVRLTDQQGERLRSCQIEVTSKQYKMFRQIFDHADTIPDYQICLAYGFREKHCYSGKQEGEIQTIKIGEHVGVLLLFGIPETAKEKMNDNEVYSIVWDFMMKLEEILPRAFMYYGTMDENKMEHQTSQIGIFLPFRHFEHQLEKNVEQANGIGLGCREKILSMMN